MNINKDEYPPKFIGYKGDGSTTLVYRINGELGLVFKMTGLKTSNYVWEHFVKFEETIKYKRK
jgi:hypothetical protein